MVKKSPDEKEKIVKIIGEANNKIYALGLKGKKEYFLKIFESKAMKQLSNQTNSYFLNLKIKKLDFEEISFIK